MKNIIQKFATWSLAGLMITFGLNKFLGFIPIEPPVDPTAQNFLGAMFTSYLYVEVALFEMIGAVLLLIPKTKFVGWLLLLPIMLNIVVFHLAHDFIGNGIWILPISLFSIVGYYHKVNIISLISGKN